MRKNGFWVVGSDRDFAIRRMKDWRKARRDLYENGRLDVTAYEPADVDFLLRKTRTSRRKTNFDDEDMLNHSPTTIRMASISPYHPLPENRED